MKTVHIILRHCAILVALVLLVAISSCNNEDPPLPDNMVNFESEELGLSSDESALTVTITLSREATEDVTLPIDVTTEGVTYDADFTTDPVIVGGVLSLPVAKGATSTSFTITKKDGALFDGDESVSFTIGNAGGSVVIGTKKTLNISFSEIISAHATMDPNVGGQLQPNKVFVDLSANRQTYFDRGAWDLGFYSVDGQFRVILNSSTAMMAHVLDKSDLTTVTAADTAGLGGQLSTDAVFAAITGEEIPDWVSSSKTWIDDPTGDVTKTAIAEIVAADSDNKVYIVNRGKNPDGSQRGWKKIRVIRNGSNYTLQHADIAATTFTTVQITRNADFLFTYVKLETGVIDLEPAKDKWDIAFTVFTNTTPLSAELTVPYVFSDIVLKNRFETQIAEILTATGGAYEDFDEADIAALTFSTSQLAIGSKWRSGGGPGSSPSLKTDRFYVVKDADGNVYKLKFTAFTQNGERGRPQIDFTLVKKG